MLEILFFFKGIMLVVGVVCFFWGIMWLLTDNSNVKDRKIGVCLVLAAILAFLGVAYINHNNLDESQTLRQSQQITFDFTSQSKFDNVES